MWLEREEGLRRGFFDNKKRENNSDVFIHSEHFTRFLLQTELK